MNELEIFNNEFGDLKIRIEKNTQFYEATAVAKILGYKDPKKAIRTHCKHIEKILSVDTIGRKQEMNYITIGDIGRLVSRSQLPEAQKIEEWIFDDIFTTVMKFGCYPAPTFNYDLDDFGMIVNEGKLYIRASRIAWQFQVTMGRVTKDLHFLSVYNCSSKPDIIWIDNQKYLGREAFDIISSKYCIAEPPKNKFRRQYLNVFDKYEMLSA